jgi:hypothetical protein
MPNIRKIMQPITAAIDGLLRTVATMMASLFTDQTRHIGRYSLKYPIRVTHALGETPITLITLRWPPPDRAQALMRIENDSERILEYLALMTGLPLVAIEEMDLEDIAELEKVISRNMRNGANDGR